MPVLAVKDWTDRKTIIGLKHKSTQISLATKINRNFHQNYLGLHFTKTSKSRVKHDFDEENYDLFVYISLECNEKLGEENENYLNFEKCKLVGPEVKIYKSQVNTIDLEIKNSNNYIVLK